MANPEWTEPQDWGRRLGTYYSPADADADERAETTGKDTECAKCGDGFTQHVNARCPE